MTPIARNQQNNQCGSVAVIIPTRNGGRWLDINGVPAMATFPAAYLLRKDEGKRAAWTDIKQVMARLQA